MTNNIEVTVRINDRGPFVRGRIIDLSYTAARRIRLVGPGTAWVRIEALGKAEERTIDGKVTTVLVKPASYTEGRFTIQVGSFKEKSNAKAVVRNLKKRYDRVRIVVFELNDAKFYRVQVEEKNTIGKALALQKRLEKEGFRDCFVVAR
jgi:rare lipoprotein A